MAKFREVRFKRDDPIFTRSQVFLPIPKPDLLKGLVESQRSTPPAEPKLTGEDK